MRRWTLFLRAFTSKDRARRWSVGACDDDATTSLPPLMTASASCTLHAAFPDCVRQVDLGSQASVSSFIKHFCNCKVLLGVEVIARSGAWSRTTKAVLTSGVSRRGQVSAIPAGVVLPKGLSGETLRVCRKVCDKKGVFETGPPGSGKTFLLRKIIRALRDAGLTVAVCGTSGVAANMVGGITARSWAGFIHGHADVSLPLDHVVHEVIPRAAKGRMRDAMALVIDEIGTMSAEFLERLDEVLRAVRTCSTPFGGVVVIFAGDFLQLAPPVGSLAFCSHVWREVFGNRATELSTTWRHVNDAVLLCLLLRLRVGAQTDDDLALLASRRTDAPPASAVWLTTHTALATAKNDTELDKLEGQAVTFSAVDVIIAPYISMAQASELLDDGTDFVRRLILRFGAVVAVHSTYFHSRGIPAGSRGVVERFLSAGPAQIPVVRFFLAGGGFETSTRMCVLPLFFIGSKQCSAHVSYFSFAFFSQQVSQN
ncbi:hypothetical protein I4F81_012410 [Pyropia yezoensis]|uniref:Uncharacterized protein n=1 Tax=Pyropia yezoensis TaxID=2788 RepID=A0ACC3CJ01_PYRYE|nr:hypothetical protein I4F81_012410 [Neopyropia yezoensis]